MKRVLCLAALAAVVLTAAPARAQVFGQYVPAEVLPVNGRMGGVYVDFSGNTAGLSGQLRLSFFPNIDFGFQGGIARYDTEAKTISVLRLGGDFRVLVKRADDQLPIDVAVGAGLGVLSGDRFNVFRVSPSVVASHSFAFPSGSSIVPFAGAALAFANWDVTAGALDRRNTDFSVPLRLGTELRVMPGVRVLGEMDLRIGDAYDDHSAFILGVNMPF